MNVNLHPLLAEHRAEQLRLESHHDHLARLAHAVRPAAARPAPLDLRRLLVRLHLA